MNTNAHDFAVELRKYWSFDNAQVHTHSWHTRENFIEQRLPELLGGNALRIVRAAIRDDHGGIHSVPIPGRHHDIIKQMRDAGYTGSVQGDRQGFLLSDGRFVMRKAAGAIARKNGQLKNGKQIAATLTSEDLW